MMAKRIKRTLKTRIMVHYAYTIISEGVNQIIMAYYNAVYNYCTMMGEILNNYF